MNQAEAAHSLLLELKRLRSEGVRDIYVEEESLLLMERVLHKKFGRPSGGQGKGSITKEGSELPSSANHDSGGEKEKPDSRGSGGISLREKILR